LTSDGTPAAYSALSADQLAQTTALWQRCRALARRDQLITFADHDRPGWFRFRHPLCELGG
jgi:hypothetical protein